MYHNLNYIRLWDLKLLALEKNTPETGNRQFTQKNEFGLIDFRAAISTSTHRRKKNPVSKTPPTAPSGLVAFSQEK